jgi:flagellar M-ring protein FliF
MALPHSGGPAALPGGEGEEFAQLEDDEEPNLIADLTSVNKHTPQKRLEQIVEFNEAQAATILKLWIHQGEQT